MKRPSGDLNNPLLYLPGLIAAFLLHAIFNHFPVSPVLSTVVTLLILPTILFLLFVRHVIEAGDWSGALLLTYFLRFFEELVFSGHVYILETPIFRVRNKQETVYCYSEAERDAAVDRLKGAEVTRFKGLGEISPGEFKQFIAGDDRWAPLRRRRPARCREPRGSGRRSTRQPPGGRFPHRDPPRPPPPHRRAGGATPP